MSETPSIISHVSVGTNDFGRAVAFYDAVLGAIGCQRIDMGHKGATAWGKAFPEFWVQTPIDGEKATIGNGTHFGFMVNSKDEVHAFYDAAIEAGGTSDGSPGPREEYGKQYYGCFIRDLDGHKIEATFWNQDAE